MKPEPQIVGYFKGEPIYSVNELPPSSQPNTTSAISSAGAIPQTRQTDIVGLFDSLFGPIDNFEKYYDLLQVKLNDLAIREQHLGIPATPVSDERHRLHQEIALVSTSLTYLRTLIQASTILFGSWLK
jgi:hypothetical protein